MWVIGKDKVVLKMSKAKARAYRKEWMQIVKETGVSDFNELVYAFTSFENQVRMAVSQPPLTTSTEVLKGCQLERSC